MRNPMLSTKNEEYFQTDYPSVSLYWSVYIKMIFFPHLGNQLNWWAILLNMRNEEQCTFFHWTEDIFIDIYLTVST